jgi:hypothetical protein
MGLIHTPRKWLGVRARGMNTRVPQLGGGGLYTNRGNACFSSISRL